MTDIEIFGKIVLLLQVALVAQECFVHGSLSRVRPGIPRHTQS
jgi:hypothetical protein